ncbi:MAG: sulfur carrier protein ThiS [Zoogloeaceae bacterium]|jgi:sulfur carrier protein|nr:sulfur carrier protein ThiS [Zoogloeaceae bacterium]
MPETESQSFTLILNGAPRHFSGMPPHLAALMRALGYEGKRVAVELNGGIIPKSRYAATPLKNGDTLEIVIAVGGG